VGVYTNSGADLEGDELPQRRLPSVTRTPRPGCSPSRTRTEWPRLVIARPTCGSNSMSSIPGPPILSLSRRNLLHGLSDSNHVPATYLRTQAHRMSWLHSPIQPMGAHQQNKGSRKHSSSCALCLSRMPAPMDSTKLLKFKIAEKLAVRLINSSSTPLCARFARWTGQGYDARLVVWQPAPDRRRELCSGNQVAHRPQRGSPVTEGMVRRLLLLAFL
jgi:hypothetical protein